jgi:small GTP-binding protein
MMGLSQTPGSLRDLRNFFSRLESQVAQEAESEIAIVGPVNSGKSTLFNKLQGKTLSKTSAVPGTTREIFSERFGPFRLVDTPGFGEVAGVDRANIARQAVSLADLVVLVLDAAAGVRQEDADLYAELRRTGVAVVVALNKVDLIRHDLHSVMYDVEKRLRTPVIPISAKTGMGIAERLIPAIIDSHPQMAVTVGRALPAFRRLAARRVIRQSVSAAAVLGLEPVPILAIPLLIAVQIRLLLRLGTIYGEPIDARRARELLTAIAGGVAIRYAAQEIAKLLPVAGWLVAAVVAASGTWALGRVAVLFFESGGKLSPEQMRAAYRRLRRRRPQPDEVIQ